MDERVVLLDLQHHDGGNPVRQGLALKRSKLLFEVGQLRHRQAAVELTVVAEQTLTLVHETIDRSLFTAPRRDGGGEQHQADWQRFDQAVPDHCVGKLVEFVQDVLQAGDRNTDEPQGEEGRYPAFRTHGQDQDEPDHDEHHRGAFPHDVYPIPVGGGFHFADVAIERDQPQGNNDQREQPHTMSGQVPRPPPQTRGAAPACLEALADRLHASPLFSGVVTKGQCE